MDDYCLVDALSGDAITFACDGEVRVRKGDGALPPCESLFFPGCSLINYAMPLATAVFATLEQQGQADGISVLCCGKILAYEPDGVRVRASFEEQLRERLAGSSIRRIIAACPNCVKALREALALDERTDGIEVVPLPTVLAGLGYRVDQGTAARLLKGDADAPVLLCAHDSCPDRDLGEFADGLRTLLGEGLYADPAHCRRRSLCCGSLPRAAGRFEAADKLARRNGEEAVEVAADAIVTSCMSCCFQLNMAQSALPAIHFLELLYDWRTDWAQAGAWMKLRFLFDEALGAVQEASEGRAFLGLSADGALQEPAATVADEVSAEEGGSAAARGVALSNDGTVILGE